MNLFNGLSWLAGLTHRSNSHSRSTDFGDMGTAFGLDAALEEPHQPAPAAPRKPAPEPPSSR